MSHEERLVNIESDLTHLEQLVESLNQTIIGQDKTIQQFQIQMNRLTSDLEAISCRLAVPVVPNW